MCSKHITFVQVVDHYSLITIGKVWSLQCSHTVCLTSMDHPHEVLDLIGSSQMLVHCRILSTVDADQTPSIDICWLLKYSGSSAKVLERLIKLFLKFGGLTTLVSHFLTSRTPGWNPREHTKKPYAHFSFFFSFSLGSFRLPTHAQGFLMPHFLSQKISTHAPPPYLF